MRTRTHVSVKGVEVWSGGAVLKVVVQLLLPYALAMLCGSNIKTYELAILGGSNIV